MVLQRRDCFENIDLWLVRHSSSLVNHSKCKNAGTDVTLSKFLDIYVGNEKRSISIEIEMILQILNIIENVYPI